MWWHLYLFLVVLYPFVFWSCETIEIGLEMIASERVGVAPVVGNVVESWLKWFGHIWRSMDSIGRKVDQMEGSLVV